MTRKDIFKILESKYDVSYEMRKICKLFNSLFLVYGKELNYQNANYTIESLVDNKFLFLWMQRNSFLNCAEIRQNLGLTFDFSSSDEILKTLEYYLNLIYLIKTKADPNCLWYKPINEFCMLIENINILLEHLNYEKLVIDKEEKVLLIPKNSVATAVAEISSEDTGLAILKYNHALLKGRLSEKSRLLNDIYKEYEPIFKNSIKNYNDFFEKANQMINTLNIRHNNTKKEDNKNTVINISNDELEKWYDELYQLLLFCILIKDNIDRKANVAKFLKTLKK